MKQYLTEKQSGYFQNGPSREVSLRRSGHYVRVDCTPSFQFSFFNHKVKLWNGDA